ncbi:hypothetical protein CBS9595_003041 [Malassezia furfur]|nr:hypothetical protein CBS9595_003041 [Malassezia furfur]
MWSELHERWQAGVDRVSRSLNEYGPPIEWGDAQSPSSWLAWLSQQSKAALGMEPPPPPPPPPTPTFTEKMGRAFARNRTTLAYVLGGAVAIGLGVAWIKTRPVLPTRGAETNGRRTQAVVVLGGETPLGRALALYLASRNLIVLVSVNNEHAKRALEFEVPPPSRGYVKALVLHAGAEDQFVRAVHAALCMRFPLTSGGDPYARPGENVQVIGVVNAASFAADTGVDPLAQQSPQALERALTTHVVTPLTTLSRLVPLLAAPPNRVSTRADPALIVSLVASPTARVTQPLQGAASIVAQSVDAGLATLKRESEVQALARDAPAHPPRPLRWTRLDVDAGNSAAFQTPPATQQLVRHGQRTAPHAPRAVLEKVASLLFARTQPLWPRYTVAGTTRLGGYLRALASAVLACMPDALVDLVIATQLRLRSTHAAHGSIDEHLRGMVREATAPPASLRPGSDLHSRGVPSTYT